ncbi:MAG: GntR family transcriptional regulator [Euzebya sp.]
MERVSLTDQVVESIRTEILGGELPPGHSLREQALSDRFDVGRSTIREAIRVLAAEGLVTQEHHRGAVVTRHTPADVDDLIAARIMIERHVAGVGVHDGSQAQAALERLSRAVAAKDWRAAAEADEVFHLAIVEAVGSPRISAFHSQVAGEMRLLLVTAARHLPEPDKVAEHAKLLRLALSGDSESYLAAAINHVSRSRDILVEVAQGVSSPISQI